MKNAVDAVEQDFLGDGAFELAALFLRNRRADKNFAVMKGDDIRLRTDVEEMFMDGTHEFAANERNLNGVRQRAKLRRSQQGQRFFKLPLKMRKGNSNFSLTIGQAN